MRHAVSEANRHIKNPIPNGLFGTDTEQTQQKEKNTFNRQHSLSFSLFTCDLNRNNVEYSNKIVIKHIKRNIFNMNKRKWLVAQQQQQQQQRKKRTHASARTKYKIPSKNPADQIEHYTKSA